MRQGTDTAHVNVLIETADGKVIYKDWKGTSISAIRRKAKAQYAKQFPDARVSFGAGYYTTSYGGH